MKIRKLKVSSRSRHAAVDHFLRRDAELRAPMSSEFDIVGQRELDDSDWPTACLVRAVSKAVDDCLCREYDLGCMGAIWNMKDLECAGLLLDGWCPGDDVMVRR